MLLPQVDDADTKYSISGVTSNSTGTEGGIWDTMDSEDLLLATDTPPPFSEDFYPPSAPSSPLLSLADQALTRLNRSASSDPANQRKSPPMDACDLRYYSVFFFFFSNQKAVPKICLFMSCSSPSLVALEVDSEEDSAEPKSPLSPLSSDVEKSDEKGEMLHPSSDLTCTRSQSASSACEPATKVKRCLRLSDKHFYLYISSLMFLFSFTF